MRSRFSNQTIAGVVAASTLLLLFFVLQLGLLSIVLALFVFLGVLLLLTTSPPKVAVEKELTIADLESALAGITPKGLPSIISQLVGEILQCSRKIITYLNGNPSESPSCLFQVISVLEGVTLAIDKFRLIAARVETNPSPALLEEYLQSAAATLTKTYSGLVQKDTQALAELVETLSQRQAILDEVSQTLGKE
ncbi:hypothetical protein LBMAG21_13140 [Armatimonadota bacterium]|nr:hypothetical protein LBMAG21_13140 [Armatimonadota bacterium]